MIIDFLKVSVKQQLRKVRRFYNSRKCENYLQSSGISLADNICFSKVNCHLEVALALRQLKLIHKKEP